MKGNFFLFEEKKTKIVSKERKQRKVWKVMYHNGLVHHETISVLIR